ncbi:MAG: DHH family phosphoesterase [Patescibacteria group bacterium]|nr:hypothetical protein [Patescibacteria group bacterium]
MKTNKEEFLAQIKKTQYPIIILPDISNKETTCAALGLYNILKNHTKKIDIVSYKKQDPQISFLTGYDSIKDKIEHSRNFLLSFDTSQNPIKNIHWEEKQNRLNIFITPKTGSISPKDFSFAPGKYCYDLVIVLGAAELQYVGACYEKNADLFFDLPIINIDYHISNEQYGQVNILDVKASGNSEIVANVFLEEQTPMPQPAADCFYAGILEATESFQTPRTTPKTLNTAANLIDSGADHKKITRSLYKTQNIKTIKLWGQLMARLKYLSSINLAWISINPEEIPDARVTTQKLRSIFDKIRNSYSKAGTLMLLWQTKQHLTRGLIQNSNRELLKDLLKGIEWGNAIIFEFNSPLSVSEKKIIKILEQGYKIES